MSVNKIKILLSETDKYVEVPVEMKWDFTGRDDSIEEYQKKMVKEILGIANDFETSRFSHNSFINEKTDINYEFYFYDNALPITATTVTSANWDITYQNEGFTPSDIYYFVKPFTKSFFKLDFYDTPEDKSQTNYFTIILPVQQGDFESASITPLLPLVDIRKPKFSLDYIGDKEGFFIYWLRERDFIDLSEFYMSAKFFNGRTGVFNVMTNTPQPNITPNKFNFLSSEYFYYKINLDYTTKTYEALSTSTNVRVGDQVTPIKWYEYINP
tara:strand:- start:6073 stop:6882 length:810 start_codon:yes stop_codon:yes gene_type:complete